MELDDSVFLRHVVDASERILKYLEGVNQAQFEVRSISFRGMKYGDVYAFMLCL